MALYELKTGNGGHGLEPFNTVTGKYEKVSFDFEGDKIDSWESLRDLMLDVSQQQIYSASGDDFKKQVDDYIKEQYEMLLQGEIDRLNKEYARGESGVEFYNSVDDMIENISSYITDDVFNFAVKNGTYSSTDDYRSIRSIAIAMHKSRYSNLKMKKMSIDEFDSETSGMEDIPDVSCGAYQYIENSYLKNNDKVLVHRGLSTTKTTSQMYDEYTEGIFSPDDVAKGTDTLLGGSNGMYGTTIYMTTHDEYTYGYEDGFKIDGYINLKNRNIYYMEDEDDSSGYNSELQTELRSKIPSITSKIRGALLGRGYSQNDIQTFLGQLTAAINGDFGFCCMLMGYDAFTAEGHQLDILNPSIVNIRGDK